MGVNLGLPQQGKNSENRVLRRICAPRKDEVTGDWRQLHNEELHNLLGRSYQGG
jgi:hypothetical protein